ncbi:MAG TPA: proton-conducting transporter membrane subunit, partial [Acidimicrobiales bacterium]|nr:proton-conducting transporter membrane subunit [Acidimicrobiales bacterium]
ALHRAARSAAGLAVNAVVLAIVVTPAAVAIATWWTPVGLSKMLTVAGGIATFVLALSLVPTATAHTSVAAGPAFRADALSIVFLVPTAFLYATTAIFATGYLHLPDDGATGRRYGRRFFAGMNLFCWAMAVAPLVNGLALLWVAIEVTTVVSALLVAIDDTDGATEAAWKYLLIASLGLGIGLLATVMMYYAGSKVFGASYDLSYNKLLGGAHGFPKEVVRLADVLAVLGFGTKMGLVPVHTWLPDAHSEAPTPISALLSGALLATSFYAILRFFEVSVRCLGPSYPRTVLLVFGLASLVLAALYLLSQRDLKRLLAYSSVEHMGILAIGMSFSAPVAIVGVLLHVIAHAAAKGTAFFGAGSILRKFKTKDMARMRGGVGLLPWSGPMVVLAVLALSAMPPFGIFRSEFLIVSGGLSDPEDAVAALLVVLVTLAFFGLSWFTTETMLTPLPERDALRLGRGETSSLIVVAMLLGLAGLVVLGVHVPGQLSELLHRAATQLEARR